VASTLLASQLEHLAIRPRLLLALTKPLDDLDLFFTGLVTMTFVALRAFGGEDIS